MNTPTTVALFTISTLSLLTSAATLFVVFVGAKKVQADVEEAKNKANNTLSNLKHALNSVEI